MSKECTTHHHACDCREEKFKQLEQENAALNHKLDEILTNKNYEGGVQFWINKHDAVLLREASLHAENAALRTVLKRWLKVADDCHQEQQEVGYSEYNITVGLVCDTRALLDAARKEAQP